MLEKLDEVISLLQQMGKTASSIIVDGDRIEVHGLRDVTEYPPLAKGYEERKEPSGREMLFRHSGIIPKHHARD